MRCRSVHSSDHSLISRWNRQLQVDEGASPMDPEAIEARLRRWLSDVYDAMLFELDSEPIGYALYRPTDPELKEPEGVYLRQFFIAPAHRRLGHGSKALRLFLDDAVRGRRLVLEALESNPGGQEFWRSQGMSVYSRTYELRPHNIAHGGGANERA